MSDILQEISPRDAYEHLEKYTIVDVRSEDERIQSRIEASIHIPLDQLESRLDELQRIQKIIVCQCRSGYRSSLACTLLREHGMLALNLRGGLIAWHNAGLPTINM